MKAKIDAIVMAAALAAGTAGVAYPDTVAGKYVLLLLGLGIVLAGHALLKAGYYKSGTPWAADSREPRPLRLGPLDYFKAFVAWADNYTRTYAIEPGLYYTGDRYDLDTPLVVTSNYHLTVFLLTRHIRRLNARLLVIDTDGINVWCAAGKGRFGNEEILRQVERYDRELLGDGKWLPLVLPKFGMSGVNLKALRNSGIKPIVGPLYAKHVATYLTAPPLRDRDDDRVNFGLQSRMFTLLPGMMQSVGYILFAMLAFIAAEAITGAPAPLGAIAVALAVAAAYPLLFPWLPGRRFAVKGLWLAGLVSAALAGLALGGLITSVEAAVGALFAFAIAIFFALSYTGNSAVSNYTRVRQEIIKFMPVDVALFVASIAAFVITEVVK